LECINCGGTINSHIVGQVVSCNYCGTTTAWLPTIEIDPTETNPEVDKLLKVAQIDIDAKRYTQAIVLLNKAIAIDPTCWQGYANLALARFWTGDTSFRHITEVKEMLVKASTFAKDSALITKISGAISYNTVQVIKIKNPVGDDLIRALHAINQTNELRPDYPEREVLLDEFINESATKIIGRLNSFLTRDGKSFDPPKTDLITVGKMLDIQSKPDLVLLKTAVCFMGVKFSKNNNIDGEFTTLLTSLTVKYKKFFNTDRTPILKFSFLKSPTIE
jgi:tetratricopeptide (TPR) repeat protein